MKPGRFKRTSKSHYAACPFVGTVATHTPSSCLYAQPSNSSGGHHLLEKNFARQGMEDGNLRPASHRSLALMLLVGRLGLHRRAFPTIHYEGGRGSAGGPAGRPALSLVVHLRCFELSNTAARRSSPDLEGLVLVCKALVSRQTRVSRFVASIGGAVAAVLDLNISHVGWRVSFSEQTSEQTRPFPLNKKPTNQPPIGSTSDAESAVIAP